MQKKAAVYLFKVTKTEVEPKVNVEHPQNEPNHNIQRRRVPTAKSLMYNEMKPMCYVEKSFEAVCNLKQNLS